MSDRRLTLTDVMLGIDKHGLVCKLSEESFTFLIGIILEHNKRGFRMPFDLNNQQAMTAGGGNTPKSVRRRRATLCKFKIDGKPLLKVVSGNYGKNTCAKYEINYESLMLYNGIWSGETMLPAQIWVGRGEGTETPASNPTLNPTLNPPKYGSDPVPILRSEEKREESSSTTSNIITTEDESDKPPKDDEDERFKWLLGLMQNAAPGWAPANDTQRQMVFELLEFTNGEIETVFHRAAQEGIRRNKLLGWVQRGLDNFDKFYSRVGVPIETKELTRAESIVEWLRYCADYHNRQHEIYPTLEALAAETGRPLLELFSENEYLTLSLDYYKEIAEEHPE